MLDHISIGARDLARSKRFYDAVLAPLGYPCLRETPDMLGHGNKDEAIFWAVATHYRRRYFQTARATRK